MSSKRKFATVLGACTALALPSSAQVAPFEHPPAPAHLEFEPIEDNPYFEQDAEDPRFLVTKPGKRGVIDRGYLKKMARPGIPESTWELLDTAGAPGVVEPLPTVQEIVPISASFGATVVEGNIIVIEGNGSVVATTQQGPMFNHNGNGAQAAISAVLQRMGDNYDFVTVFTTFQDPGAAAYYFPLRQDVTGLGECNFNQGKTFGCVFDQAGLQLQGFVFMNSLSYWRSWDFQFDGFAHALDDFDASVYAVLGQEIAHRWGSGLRFKDPRSGAISERLLGRDGSHWAAYVDTDASVMDGWDWEFEENTGNFLLVGDMERFSTLDLYTMGAQPVGSARPFFFIDGARFIPNAVVGNQPVPADAALQVPSVLFMDNRGINLRASGEKVDLTVQDIVDAEGVRCPDPDHTQKTFKQAIVLVTRPGETAGQVSSDLAALQQVMTTWEAWWKDRTDNALTLCTDLFGDCAHAEVELGDSVINGGELVEPGMDFDMRVDLSASGDEVRNARATVRLLGNGAESAFLDLEDNVIDVGNLAAGESTDFEIPISLDDDYPCGLSLIVEVTLRSDNAQTRREEYRVFPGYTRIFEFDFDEGDDEFTTNDDGLDDFTSGGMIHTDIELSCFITPRTPERDASPGGKGAWVTGQTTELNGETSLWSGRLPLDGAVDPEIRFNFWLDAPEGSSGKLVVMTSETGEKFQEAKVYDEPFHGWVLGRVDVREVYDRVPDEIHVLFLFQGDGQVEGAIDDFFVLDRDGQCRAQFAFCGCSSSGDGDSSEPTFGLAAILGLGGLVLRRRRKRAARA